jgi:hypothetical protein
LRTRYRKNRGGGERDIIAVIFRDDVIAMKSSLTMSLEPTARRVAPSRRPEGRLGQPASRPPGASFRQTTASLPIPTTPSSTAWMSCPWSRRKPGTKTKCTKVPLHIVTPVGVVGLRTCWRRRRRTNLSEDYGPPPRGNPPSVRPKSAASRLVKIPFSHFTFSTDPSIFQGCRKSL